MEVYLLRHGETDANVKKVFAGHSNVMLTDKGKTQAENAFMKFRDIKFTKVYVSSLQRAIDTLKPFKREDYLVCDELKEMNFGRFEGFSFENIKEYQEEFEKWRELKNKYQFPEGESFEMFFERINTFYQYILKESNKEDIILIVAHSGVIGSILSNEIAGSIDGYWKFKVENCGMSVIEYVDGFPVLKGFNL